jgi:plastocyanin
MRARTLAVAAALSISILFAGASSREAYAAIAGPTDSCPLKELGSSEGKICRQLTLFGIRFTPKVMKIRAFVPKNTAPYDFPAGTQITMYWRNTDRVDHHIQSMVSRDVEGNLMGIRDPETGEVDCTGVQTCFDYDSGVIPAREAAQPGQKRPQGTNSQIVTFPKPGSYTFQCSLHPSMTQSVQITMGQKFR